MDPGPGSRVPWRNSKQHRPGEHWNGLFSRFEDLVRMKQLLTFSTVLLTLALTGCPQPERELVLPDADEASAWFGPAAEATISGNVLEIRGVVADDFIRRGGRIWERSGPYFYLFNIHVQALLRDYPDLAAVRAITFTSDGEELARATLHRAELSEIQWREALGRASLAQSEGTASPRRIEDLIRYGEDRTEFSYAR